MNALFFAIVVAFAAPDAALPDAGMADAGAPVKKIATGTPPVAQLECTPSPARIADVVKCTVTLTHRKEVSVVVSAPDGAIALPSKPAETLPDGRLKTERLFTLQQMELKDLIIGEIRVDWRDGSGGEAVVKVPGTRIKITSVIGTADKPQFHTYKAPQSDAEAFWDGHGGLPVRVFNTPAFIVAMVLLGGLVGVALFILLRRFLRKPEVEVEWVDPRPAHIIAIERLDQLVAEDLPGQGDVKGYYTRLSEITRFYLELRFGFGALEMTSDEIRGQIDQLKLAGNARVGVDDFLSESDLVKFAGFTPEQSGIDTIMRLARGLIELTRAPDETPAAEGQA